MRIHHSNWANGSGVWVEEFGFDHWEFSTQLMPRFSSNQAEQSCSSEGNLKIVAPFFRTAINTTQLFPNNDHHFRHHLEQIDVRLSCASTHSGMSNVLPMCNATPVVYQLDFAFFAPIFATTTVFS
jgi:hypothetical protein